MSCFVNCFGEKKNRIHTEIIESNNTNNNQIEKKDSKVSKNVNTFPMSLEKFNFEKYSHKRTLSLESNIPEFLTKKNRFGENKKGNKKINIYNENSVVTAKKPLLFDFKDKFLCLFCGGSSCKHENWTLHPNPAIRGLNSDRITTHIFASQRFSNRLIKEFKLIKQFKDLGIGLIVNLQREGEHPYCGDKLDLTSGFSYDPQHFICENIKCKNYGWKDMSIPNSVYFMLNIVKDMAYTIKEEKKQVIVHCHAGYGRTGCAIACYMLYDSAQSLETIVSEIRNIRRNCIEKKSQLDFCKKFQEFINSCRILFTPTHFNIDYFLKNQNNLLIGEEQIRYYFIPKLLANLFEKIIEMKNDNLIDNLDIYNNFYVIKDWTYDNEVKLVEFKKRMNNGEWCVLEKIDHVPTMIQLFYDWLEDCVEYLILPEKLITLDTVISEEEIINQINNYRNLDRSQRKNICLSLKNHFRTIEFEILICITEFVSNIMPQQSENLFFYNRMMERLCLAVTGINIEKVKYQFIEKPSYPNLNRHLPQEIILLFRNFNIIIEFLSIILRYDLQEENVSLFFGQNDMKNNIHNFSKYYGYVNSSQIPPSLSSKTLHNLNELNLQLDKQSEKEMPEKEQILYLIYGALDNYFKKKNKNLKNFNLNSSLESISNDDAVPKINIRTVNNGGSNNNFYEKKAGSVVAYNEDFFNSNLGLAHLNSVSNQSKMTSSPKYDQEDANELIERFAKLLLPKHSSPSQTLNHGISSNNSNSRVNKLSSSAFINKNSKQSASNLVLMNNSYSKNSYSRNETRNLEWDGDGELNQDYLYHTKRFPSKNHDKRLTVIPELDNYSEGNHKSSNDKISMKNLSNKEIEKIKIHRKKSSNITVDSNISVNHNEKKNIVRISQKNSNQKIPIKDDEERFNHDSIVESDTSNLYLKQKWKTSYEEDASLQQNSMDKKYFSSKNVLLSKQLSRIVEEGDSVEKRNDETISKNNRSDYEKVFENVVPLQRNDPGKVSLDFKTKYDDYFNAPSNNSSYNSNLDHFKVSNSLGKGNNNTLNIKKIRIWSGKDLTFKSKNTNI